MNNFAHRLKQLRKQQKCTMKTLAQALNVSEAYISMLESQKRLPTRELVKQIAEVLGTVDTQALQDELLILAGFSPENLEAFQVPQDPLRAFQEKLEHNPNDFALFQGYVQTLIKTGRLNEAQKQAQKGLQQFQNAFQLHCLIADLELARQQFQAALVSQKAALEQYAHEPKNSPRILALLTANLGGIYFQLGLQAQAKNLLPEAEQHFLNAEQAFEQALKEQPENCFTRDEYARVCFNLADLKKDASNLYWDRCIKAFEHTFQSPQLHILGESNKLESALFWAYAHCKKGEPETALKLLQSLSLFHSKHWLIFYLSACVYLQLFTKNNSVIHLESAKQAYQRSLERDPIATKEQAARDPDLALLRQNFPQEFANSKEIST